jgi:glutamate-1-semialdehyde aminotransferase
MEEFHVKGLVSKYPYGYYEDAKGVNVWSSWNKLIDMGIMGVGSCILGYADDDVNKIVKQCIDRGSMSTYNCYEDIELAEILLKLHPWADKVRYARSGGEAMMIAFMLAQQYSEYSKVVHCGYHGWQLGEPDSPNDFEFNNVESLENCIKNEDPRVIIMEIMRHEEPTEEFLEAIKEAQKGRILIIDEITSGFRMCNGGAHLKYGLEPDIAVFGKAIGNGFPITAVVGKEEVMNTDAFISSTFWTERIGPTAAIATINKILKLNVVESLTILGKKLSKGLNDLGIQTKIPYSLLQLEIEDVDWFREEMLKRGYIAGNQIYLSYAHSEQIIKDYLKEVEKII